MAKSTRPGWRPHPLPPPPVRVHEGRDALLRSGDQPHSHDHRPLPRRARHQHLPSRLESPLSAPLAQCQLRGDRDLEGGPDQRSSARPTAERRMAREHLPERRHENRGNDTTSRIGRTTPPRIRDGDHAARASCRRLRSPRPVRRDRDPRAHSRHRHRGGHENCPPRHPRLRRRCAYRCSDSGSPGQGMGGVPPQRPAPAPSARRRDRRGRSGDHRTSVRAERPPGLRRRQPRRPPGIRIRLGLHERIGPRPMANLCSHRPARLPARRDGPVDDHGTRVRRRPVRDSRRTADQLRNLRSAWQQGQRRLADTEPVRQHLGESRSRRIDAARHVHHPFREREGGVHRLGHPLPARGVQTSRVPGLGHSR